MTLLEKAIIISATAHKDQKRKGSNIPYIVHPYSVGCILLKKGYSETLAIAGILHDTVEDTELTIMDIEKEFGKKIADIVQACSEPDKNLTWEKRKKHTIDYLKTADIDIKIVACADKLNNINSMINDYKLLKDNLWKKFARGFEKQSWYYKNLVKSLFYNHKKIEKESIFYELKNAVTEIFGEID